jgi:hypothetical protein
VITKKTDIQSNQQRTDSSAGTGGQALGVRGPGVGVSNHASQASIPQVRSVLGRTIHAADMVRLEFPSGMRNTLRGPLVCRDLCESGRAPRLPLGNMRAYSDDLCVHPLTSYEPDLLEIWKRRCARSAHGGAKIAMSTCLSGRDCVQCNLNLCIKKQPTNHNINCICKNSCHMQRRFSTHW